MLQRSHPSILPFAAFVLGVAALAWSADAPGAAELPLSGSFPAETPWTNAWNLAEGQAVEIRVGVKEPSRLPPNARVRVEWSGPKLERFSGERGDLRVESTADWSKTLHALDPTSTWFIERPRRAATPRRGPGRCAAATPDYHRDDGLASKATPLPTRTPAPAGAEVEVELRRVERLAGEGLLLEAEPNDTPELAMELPLAAGDADQTLRVIGGGDELEYFNNPRSGQGPDDWFRVVHRGSKPKLLTANLQLVEPVVSARMRFYREGRPTAEELEPREPPPSTDFGNANPVPYVHPPAEILDGPRPVYTFYDGRDINERLHQQDDNFRSFLARKIQPGETYYLRVEANQPGYELEIRLIDGAPFDDPRDAMRQAIYYQLAEVDAWLIHRPRNIAIHTRVRDGSSLFGESCMSCHTQSGVWGVADAFRHGYRPDGTSQNHRRLVNTMYESLRPTIKLEDGASNTSLAPNDLGDAPAGSRVAGRNIVLHERTFRPKKLHSYQQRRTANYVLMTADPQGINAAGKGSNFGPNVVFKFAAEILERAWRDTGDPKYFVGLEEKARKILETGDNQLKVTDDLGHRIEFVHDLFPKREEYLETVARLSDRDPQRLAAAGELMDALERRAKRDLERLLALQQDNGGWGFDLGVPAGDSWTRMDETPDAAPTAVALIALRAAGYGPDDAPVRRAVDWLLQSQYPYGLWNKAAQTGFVTNAYVIRALSRLFPGGAPELERAAFEPRPGESPLAELARVRALEKTGRADFADLMIAAAGSEHPRVRYHAYLGLGGALAEAGLPALIEGLGDPVKACREAAMWSLRQLLLDDKGWPEALDALRAGDDRTRQAAAQALVTRADLSGSRASVAPAELATAIAAAFEDPHPGVRAYAPKASWRWWVWNPEMRTILNRAWVGRLSRPEPNAHAETALRYSTAAMLIVNGQIANQTGGDNVDQQYRELSELFRMLDARRKSADEPSRRLLDRRLTAAAATHFQERGNDGGPGQMGYSTPGASETLGDAVLAVYRTESDEGDTPWRKIALEGAANINHAELQTDLLTLLQSGDLEMVAVAAKALSNPQAIELKATPETLRPMLETVERFLADGRPDDAAALVGFLSKVRWSFEGVSEAQEREVYELLTRPRRRTAGGRAPGANLLGRPAPSPAPPPEPEATGFDERAALLGRILGENRSLQRPAAFDFVAGGSPELWLPSTDWMLAYEHGSLSAEEALEGAVEAESLRVLELTFGRTTEQLVPDGLASRNTVLWWREATPGAKLTFAVDAPEAGAYELIAAFLQDREMGIVRFSLNGEEIGESWDFYRESLSATGPASLGVLDLKQGENQLTVTMLGANPAAEPNYVFGLDYLKIQPDKGTGTLFSKDDQGVDVIDPIVVAKGDVVAMFTRWFSPETPKEIREQAIRLANKTALRRNPTFARRWPSMWSGAGSAAQDASKTSSTAMTRCTASSSASSSRRNRAPRRWRCGRWDREALDRRPVVLRTTSSPSLNKISETDNRACISCHGVPGRVPTLYLAPPDAAGYIAPEDLLANYRKMQQRVDLTDVERSKFLIKPLNVQTGEEDGHQGGARYEEDEPGYRLIREWVLKQHRLQTAR